MQLVSAMPPKNGVTTRYVAPLPGVHTQLLVIAMLLSDSAAAVYILADFGTDWVEFLRKRPADRHFLRTSILACYTTLIGTLVSAHS